MSKNNDLSSHLTCSTFTVRWIWELNIQQDVLLKATIYKEKMVLVYISYQTQKRKKRGTNTGIIEGRRERKE